MPGRCACTVQFTEKTLQKRLTKGGAAGIITHVAGHEPNMWGISSAGRALAWHARGQRFDPAILHQKSTVLRLKYGAFLFLCRKKWGLHCLVCIVFRCFAGGSVQPPSHWCFGRSEGAGSADDLQHLIEHLFHLAHQRELGAGAVKVVAGAGGVEIVIALQIVGQKADAALQRH